MVVRRFCSQILPVSQETGASDQTVPEFNSQSAAKGTDIAVFLFRLLAVSGLGRCSRRWLVCFSISWLLSVGVSTLPAFANSEDPLRAQGLTPAPEASAPDLPSVAAPGTAARAETAVELGSEATAAPGQTAEPIADASAKSAAAHPADSSLTLEFVELPLPSASAEPAATEQTAIAQEPAPSQAPLPDPNLALEFSEIPLPTQSASGSAADQPAPQILIASTPNALDLRPTPLRRANLQQLSQSASDLLNQSEVRLYPVRPQLRLQGLLIGETDAEISARIRLSGLYPINSRTVFGGTLESRVGNIVGTDYFDIHELFITHALNEARSVRISVGRLDLTSYFDRNSFAKDIATHFFNPAFQTSPALAAAGVGSQPAVLFNWTVNDFIEVKLAGFSSRRPIDDLEPDSFAGEVAFRLSDWGLLRLTYVNSVERRQRGDDDDPPRQFNLIAAQPGDREQAFGVNLEAFIPDTKLGVFARFGHYDNLDRDRGSANSYSLGINLLDLWVPRDRLGLGYGTLLSNGDFRRELDRPFPDALELFYDRPLNRFLRIAGSLQLINSFSEVVLGVRLRADFDLLRRRP